MLISFIVNAVSIVTSISNLCDAQGNRCTNSTLPSCSCCSGWEGPKCDKDVDECARFPSLCSYSNSHCDNNIGSYLCKCNAGYTLVGGSLEANGTCKDIDECTVGTARCSHTCLNTDGGYTCSCSGGYLLQPNNHTCRDLDECQETSLCPIDAVCANTDGNYTCTCPSGYTYNLVNYKCDNVDECGADPGLCVNSVCQDVPGSFQCTCDTGYTFFNKTFCKDINECLRIPSPCPNMGCKNKPGGFTCDCTHGWKYNESSNTCDKQPWNTCQQICEHDPYSGKVDVCVCKCLNGYKVHPSDPSLCLDRNECKENPGTCGIRTCVNTPNSFYCECPAGFENDWSDSGKCIDVNECENQLIAKQCTSKLFRECCNSEGGYSCSCRHGYEEVQGVCTQIDECNRGTSGCEYYCHDIAGGFYCSCPYGQKLDENGLNCSLIECGFPKLDNCKANETDCEVATAVCNDTDYYLNSDCQLSCNRSLGYYLDGPNGIKCTDQSLWDDDTSKCWCSDKESVKLAWNEIQQPVGVMNVEIPIIMEVPACRKHDVQHFITIPTYKFYPKDWVPLWAENNTLIVNKDLFQLAIEHVYTAHSRKNLTFKMIVSHPDGTVVDEREMSLTVINTPQPPKVYATSRSVTLQSYLTEKKTPISVEEYDEDHVTCTFNDDLLGVDLQLVPPSALRSRLTYAVIIKVLNGTFKDVKEIRNNGTSPYLFSKELECVDDSPQRLKSSTLINITFNINDYIVEINRIQVEPNSTLLTQVQARFEIRAFGFFKRPYNVRQARDQVQQNDIENEEAESTTFEIELRDYSQYFKVKDRTLQYIKQVEKPGRYNLPILIKNTQSHDEVKEYNVTIDIQGPDTPSSTVVPLVIAGVVIMLVVTIIWVIVMRRRPTKEREKTDSHRLNPLYSQELQSYYLNMENLEIHFDKTLGCGHFGVVYLGSARCLKNSQRRGIGEEEWVKVAVKELKNMDKLSYSEAFHKEVKALTTYKHRNIISLLGIGLCEGQHRYIIMEHMDEGSLKQFLCTLKTEKNSRSELGDQHFIYMAAQVSDAMTFMERSSAIHRDLAARNCLVNSKLLVKVADLGSAASLHSDSGSLCDYYQIGLKPVPVRWTSPEVLRTLKHSTASDVWSFGILFWEILTLCERPYGEYSSDAEALEAIKGGKQMEVPLKYEGVISNLIRSCWEIEPEKRPSFSDILALLQGVLMSTYKVAYTEKKDQLEVDIGML